MKSFEIENKKFNLDNIKQFYVASIVKTGYKDETTEVSLDWYESEGKGRVELVGFGIIIITKDKNRHQFLFKTKDELDRQMSLIAREIG
jgi:hypothetical protein